MRDAHFDTVQGPWFFTKDMLGSTQGRETDRNVEMVRQTVNNRVDLRVA